MDFFGLGFGEILFIIVIALLVFGPEKVPEIARGMGRTLRSFKQAASGFTEAMTKELDAARVNSISDSVKEVVSTAKKATSEVSTTVKQGAEAAQKATADISTSVQEGAEAAQQATADVSTSIKAGVETAKKAAADLSTTVKEGAEAAKQASSDLAAAVAKDVQNTVESVKTAANAEPTSSSKDQAKT